MDNFEFVFIYLRAIENSFYMTYLIVYFADFSIGLYVLLICWHCLCFKEIGFLLGYVLKIIFFLFEVSLFDFVYSVSFMQKISIFI